MFCQSFVIIELQKKRRAHRDDIIKSAPCGFTAFMVPRANFKERRRLLISPVCR